MKWNLGSGNTVADVLAFSTLAQFLVESLPVLHATKMALGTLFLQQRRCVFDVVYAEARAVLEAMLTSPSSLSPSSLPAHDQRAATQQSHLCRASLYLDTVFENSKLCKDCLKLCKYFHLPCVH